MGSFEEPVSKKKGEWKGQRGKNTDFLAHISSVNSLVFDNYISVKIYERRARKTMSKTAEVGHEGML